MSTLRAKILATGSHLPPRRVTNADLAERVFTNRAGEAYQLDAAEIEARTGIRARHLSDQPTSALAAAAAADCLARAGIGPQAIDLLLVATSTPDHAIPKVAPRVATLLGAEGVAAYDVGKDCTGFVEALDVAAQYVMSGSKQRVLVVGADRMSAVVDPANKATAVVFGDGAGAALVGPAEGEGGFVGALARSLGSSYDRLLVPAGGSARPLWETPHPEPREQYLFMDGKAVFELASAWFPRIVKELCAEHDLTPQDLALIIPHQSNRRIIERAMASLDLPDERVFIHLEETGNTAAASVALALDDANRLGRLKPDDLVALVSYGAGVSMVAALIRW
jgi:3-oxoacyl-[acyl-carrier-protein] synthase III